MKGETGVFYKIKKKKQRLTSTMKTVLHSDNKELSFYLQGQKISLSVATENIR